MKINQLLSVSALTAASVIASDTTEDYSIIGSFIFGRHNDREAKPAVIVTPIGAENQYKIGQFYRQRYFGLISDNEKTSDDSTVINGLNSKGYYIDGQLYAETAQSSVLITSHYAFLQGLYPPTGQVDASMANETLAMLSNGSVIENPLSGYQYVKTNLQQNATDNYIWVKGDENCPSLNNAIKQVRNSDHVYKPGNESYDFFQSLYEIDFIKETFKPEELVFSNSNNIFDEVLVNTIHNATVAKQINSSLVREIKSWADLYQWTISDKEINSNLTIGAQTLVNRIANKLNTTLTTGKPFLNYFTGSFNNMFQLSSILELYTQDERFKTMPSYGATYVFELLSDSDNDTFVRFSFKNGTDEMGDELTSYPLFNGTETVISWEEFVAGINSVSLSSVSGWCEACGYSDVDPSNNLDMCVPSSDLYETALNLDESGIDLKSVHSSDSDLSLADAGGIGAGVTVGVFLILGGILFLYKRVKNQTQKNSTPILPVTSTDDTTEAASTIGKSEN